jgi:hypothetical protein
MVIRSLFAGHGRRGLIWRNRGGAGPAGQTFVGYAADAAAACEQRRSTVVLSVGYDF